MTRPRALVLADVLGSSLDLSTGHVVGSEKCQEVLFSKIEGNKEGMSSKIGCQGTV